ncbi:MAG: alcohol dehydrogenase catalytic domain-containing protein [Planctomycetota bacterium]|nr:alcohol dehydrogenase catalytic domain-containing protein [Planctomycetota bacterium]
MAKRTAARAPRLKRRMPVALLTRLRRIELASRPVPEPGEGEVLLRMTAVGLCGSDLHYWRCGRIGDQVVRFPQPLGHEPAGRIAALGKGCTRGLREGQLVAIEPGIWCGHCIACEVGRQNLCYRMRFLGAPGEPGALQPFLAMPEANVEPLPDGLTEQRATTAEPLGIVLQTFDLVGLRPGERIAVIGGGPVGLCVAAMARAVGAQVVALSEPRRARAKTARALGVPDVVGSAPEALIRAAHAATDELGVDVALECSGNQDGLSTAIQAARRGGRVGIVGIPEVDVLEVDPHVWRRKELAIFNTRRSNRTLHRALRVLADRDLGLERAGYFTRTLGLEGLQAAMEDLEDEGSKSIKLTVLPVEE